jgi:putative intracellular protease/amidase
MIARIGVGLFLILGISSVGWTQTRNFFRIEKKLNVAIFVFPGMQIIDYAGPYEVFGQARANVYTVGEKLDPIQTAFGQTITPKYTFENAPKPDVLVLPGGDGVVDQMTNSAVIKWIQVTARDAQQTLTVCTGSFLAAKAGLLEGLSATTFYGALDFLPEQAPHTKVVWDKKYVDSGKIITTAGLSSGIEGSLYTVSKLLGMGSAQAVALNMEYDWHPDSTYARAMFPDLSIPPELSSALPKGFYLLNSSGDRDHWTIAVRISGSEGALKVLENINTSLIKSGKWIRSASKDGDNTSRWNFTDRLGAKWQSVVSVKQGQGSDLLFALKMDRI